MNIDIFKTDSYRIYYDVDRDMILTDGFCEQSKKLKEYYTDFKKQHYDRFLNILGYDIEEITKKQLIHELHSYFENVDSVDVKLTKLYYNVEFYRSHVDKVLKEISAFKKKSISTINLRISYDIHINIFFMDGLYGYKKSTARFIKENLDLVVYKSKIEKFHSKDLREFMDVLHEYGTKHYDFNTNTAFKTYGNKKSDWTII